jgi:two-component sensor histidine kinase
LDSVGEETLRTAVCTFLDLLETAVSVFEKNGDYALGIYTTGWCRCLNVASRKLCDTKDNKKAMTCGKWLCHESCWKIADQSIATGEITDEPSACGIRTYAVPIKVNEVMVGSIDFCYGDPPKAANELNKLADLFHVDVKELKKAADDYRPRSLEVIEIAKKQLKLAAQFIGIIVEQGFLKDDLQYRLEEKELLLSEIHHRVKNNMQIIISLLQLQSQQVQDKSYISILKESENRIRALALIHEKLYRSKDLSHINCQEYILDFVQLLLELFGVNDKIELKIDINQAIQLNLDQAIPLGLIINELITNILKHAFPSMKAGAKIEVTLVDLGDDSLELVIADNGIGLPAGFDWQKTDTLGLKLVKMLAKQLGDDILCRSDSGVIFEITFKREKI